MMAPSGGLLVLLAAVVTSSLSVPFARAQPLCARQTGLGQQYIYSSLTLGTDVNPYNAGPIYVDETRELLFTSWNGGVSNLNLPLFDV